MDYSLYHIEPPEFRIIERHEIDGNITYDLEPAEEPVVCPICGFDTFIQYGKFSRDVRDLSEHAKKVGLVIHSHRYFCQNCHSIWVPSYKSIADKARMTNRMREYIRVQALKEKFSHISRELDISVTTIKGIFSEYVAELDAKRKIVAPRVLGMDENKLNGAYRCIFTDIENHLIIDMTANRKLTTVCDWIARLPEKERIECVTVDMWGPYKEAVNAELPGIPIVIDKFHVVKHLHEALDGIRKEEQDKLTTKQRRQLKNSKWLLSTNYNDLDDSQKIRLEFLLGTYPQFREPHRLKEDFKDTVYGADDRKSAEKAFKKWSDEAIKYPQYAEFIEMVENWNDEIFNYFDHRYTNAVTEALNAICKEIAAAGRGYTFDVLRAKILYGTKASKPAKYHYYKEKKPETLPADTFGFMTRSDGIYEKVGAFIPEDLKKRRIEVSSGVDIKLLEYYLRLQGLWNLEP